METLQQVQEAIAGQIGRQTQGAFDLATPIPELTLFRREAPMGPFVCRVEPSLVLVAQGCKQMLLGSETHAYDVEHYLLTALDIPAYTQVLAASPEAPCLGLTLKLDLRLVPKLIAQGGLAIPEARSSRQSMGIGEVTLGLLEPVRRLVSLLDEPGALPVLAPLIQREIHYRLLMGGQARRLREIASVGSQSHGVSRAIEWLKCNYTKHLRIEDLAFQVRMSPSSLHHHFRRLTAMSPLQYQKWLRLNEAKRLMLNEHLDAAGAAFEVGYESPSQFSREYNRLFGAPPKRDVERLKRRVPEPVQAGAGDGMESLAPQGESPDGKGGRERRNPHG